MDRDEIRRVVKGLIAKVTDLAPEDIADNASFRDDLELDSLAMIEMNGTRQAIEPQPAPVPQAS